MGEADAENNGSGTVGNDETPVASPRAEGDGTNAGESGNPRPGLEAEQKAKPKSAKKPKTDAGSGTAASKERNAVAASEEKNGGAESAETTEGNEVIESINIKNKDETEGKESATAAAAGEAEGAAGQAAASCTIGFAAIESKWQQEWADAKIFEANADEKRPKYFITVPYPYVNGAPHVGHSYTFLRTDCFARYKRMKGFNVLFPQGFHATGEPILGTLERLFAGDKAQIDTFHKYGVSDEQLKEFRDKGPMHLAKFWMQRWIADLTAVGASIDWRRKFITTTLTPTYSRFIEWQYNTLRRKGMVFQGTHPVVWCPHDESPTGDHDRYEGEGESPQEFFVLKFTLDDGRTLPPATLRPETIFGVTCVFLNPDAEYLNVRVGNETWVLTAEAAKKIADQKKSVKMPKSGFPPSELFGRFATNPVNGARVPILPATFVKTDHTTGVVMSVPSHAPFDWVAEEDMKRDPSLVTNYGVDAKVLETLKPIPVIKVEGYEEHPVTGIIRRLGIRSQKDEALLEVAKKEIYKKEHFSGVMLPSAGKYAGMKVDECKQLLVKDLREAGSLDSFWETTEEVVCRCMTKCHVKILENQWFLKFSDPEWKKQVRECMEGMRFYPEDVRQQFYNTIDWLDNKACARRSGLGTPLPWDPEWLVETLSDSVIYMAYYAIARVINERGVDAKHLPDCVFDYVFLGEGNVKELKNFTGLSDKVIEEMRREFEYFYPLDFRNSAVELVQNHLTYSVFHHVAIFPREKWPRAFSINGYVNVEGEKMSKSKGNILPMSDLVKQYGADLVRLNIVSSSEGLSDADWKTDSIRSHMRTTEFLFFAADLLGKLPNTPKPNFGRPEEVLESKVNAAIKSAEAAYSELKFRAAAFELEQNAVGALREYHHYKDANREKYNQKVFRACLEQCVLALCPLLPHTCEEAWHRLGNKTFASVEKYPAADEAKIRPQLIAEDALVSAVEEDIRKISEVAKIKPKKITIIAAASWKSEELEGIVAKISEGKDFKADESIKSAMEKAENKTRGAQVAAFMQAIAKKGAHSFAGYKKSDEKAILSGNAALLKKKFAGAEDVVVLSEEEAASTSELAKKAEKALPGRPAIVLE